MVDLCSDHPTLTPWWVLALVEELPDTSAYVASLQGGREYRGWGWDRHIYAAIFDAIQMQSVVTARCAGAKDVKAPPPLPRPGQKSSGSGTPMRKLMKMHAQVAQAMADKNAKG